VETSKHHIEPAAGRLGVLTVGLGAVASTVMAGIDQLVFGAWDPIADTAYQK
jgi:myo-inositol-1-phosphate synthase